MCKLHSFDNSTKSWTERGMSCLRINERGEEPPYTYRIGIVPFLSFIQFYIIIKSTMFFNKLLSMSLKINIYF